MCLCTQVVDMVSSLHVAKSLDYEKQKLYVLDVLATDNVDNHGSGIRNINRTAASCYIVGLCFLWMSGRRRLFLTPTVISYHSFMAFLTTSMSCFP